MKFGARKTAGREARSVNCSPLLWLPVLALIISGTTAAQSLYKYGGENGEWIYTDRQPAGDQSLTEVRALPRGMDGPEVEVTHEFVDGQVRFSADNRYYSPVELVLELDDAAGFGLSPSEQRQSWILQPRNSSELMRLQVVPGSPVVSVEYRYTYFPGDPNAEHRPIRAYRAPYVNAGVHHISQAYPDARTHTTSDSRHAVDIAMPIGTDIYAARGGTVVEVASSNYRGGFDTSRDGADANIVRILHDDGTFAIYAHLNWNSIRVQIGDQVVRGEYIADSGNTGFSTGPHLHFVVVRNSGLAMQSVPIVFEGWNGSPVMPRSGEELTAY
jgi:murein DD-endopeptidase MepM/ murein hydrolase activator NlpD